MLKRSILILILILVMLNGCSKKGDNIDLYQSIIKNDKIVVGISFDSKPFGFKDSDGTIKGLEADLAREIAKRLLGDKNKVIFKNITPQERINAAKTGEVDIVISTMTITPQRKKLVSFSEPYSIAGQAICVKKDSKVDSYPDLNNKKVIVIIETTGEKNIRKLVPNALVQGYADNADAINAFKNGSDAAITTDDSLLQGPVMENKDYILLPERLSQEPYGIAFQKSKQTKIFKENINKIINQIMYDGSLEMLKDKWGIS